MVNFVTFNNSTPTDAENTINPVGKTDGVLGTGGKFKVDQHLMSLLMRQVILCR